MLAISIATGNDKHGDHGDNVDIHDTKHGLVTIMTKTQRMDPQAFENEKLAGTTKSVMMRTTTMMMRKTQRTYGFENEGLGGTTTLMMMMATIMAMRKT